MSHSLQRRAPSGLLRVSSMQKSVKLLGFVTGPFMSTEMDAMPMALAKVS